MALSNEDRSKELEEEEAPIHGDALEAIISHVPLIDLVGASHVSKSWNRSVYSSLNYTFNKPKPWLILHSQATRPPYTTTTHAYDPRSHVWIEISQPSIKYVSSLMSSHSNLLYMLSISKLSFSFDPLNLDWHHIDAPLIWRVDPVVAKVGDSIVIAGGTCDFEDNPLAVEAFNINTRKWRTCETMPYLLKNSASSTWLSIASSTTCNKLFIMEKSSGVLHSFDVETDRWSGPHDFNPDQNCFCSLIGMVGDRLIVVGMIGDTEEVKKVKIWEMELKNFSCKLKGEMPLELIEKLRSNTFGFNSIEICSERGIVYMYNSDVMEDVVVCELLKGGSRGGSGGCSWGSVRNPVDNGYGLIATRMASTCADVTLPELQRAMKTHHSTFKEIIFAGNTYR